MSDGVNVDWSLLKTPDYAGDYANAFTLGRQMASDKGQAAASAQFATDPMGGANAMMAYNPQLGLTMRTAAQNAQDRQSNIDAATAAAGGDYAGATRAAAATGNLDTLAAIQNMSNAQRQAAVQKAQIVAGVLHTVQTQTPDPTQRLALVQHIAATSGYGIDPNSITLDDVTDAGIAGHVATAMTLEQQLAQENKAAELRETNRHNVAEEGRPQYEKLGPGETGVLVNPAAVAAASGAGGTPGAPVQAGPADLDAMARAMVGEAGGEGDQGMSAVGHVILNRAAAAPGTSIANLVHSPGQFQGLASPRAAVATSDPTYQRAYQLAQAITSGQTPDPTGGATNFLNPTLQAAQGHPMPPWAQGPATRIGNHVFYGGQGAAAPRSAAAPYQVASLGATPGPPSDPPPSGGVIAPAAPAARTIAGTPLTLGDPNGGQAPGDPTKTGDAYLQTLDPATRSQVQAILDGRMVVPSGAALRSPQIARLVAAAATADPSFDQANAGARAKTRASFSAGPDAHTVVSFNTALGHLDQLDKSIDGLRNGSIPFGNNTVNFWKQQLGDSSIDKFKTDALAAATEFSKALQGGAPHETEIQQWAKQLNEDKSPAQLHATVREMADLLASKVNELGNQYSQGMGVTRDGITLLHPEAAATLARLGGGNAAEAAAKAQFYQRAEASGMPARNIDGAWQQFAKGKTFGQTARGAPAANDDAALLAKYGIK